MVRTVSISSFFGPQNEAASAVCTELMFLQNSPKTAHKNLTLMAQGVMDVVPEKPFSVMLSNFGHRAVHIPKHTVVGLALPSPTHILTLGESAAEAAEAKEGEGYLIPTPQPQGMPREKQTTTARTRAGLNKPRCPGRPSGRMERINPKTPPPQRRTPTPGRRTSTSVPRTRKYARRSSRYCPNLRTCGPAGWEKSGPRSTGLSSSPVPARFTRRLTAPDRPHGKRRKRRLTGCSGQG